MSLEEFNQYPHRLAEILEKWARERPNDIAIIDADDGKWITWKDFNTIVDVIALEMIEEGYIKGDIVVTMLPLLVEHIYLSYACFKLGLIFCPLDVRLKEHEVVRSVKLLKNARRILYIHPDDTDSEDKWGRKKFYAFKQFARAVKRECPYVKDFIQFGPQEDADEGTIGVLNFTKRARSHYRYYLEHPEIFKEKMAELKRRMMDVDPYKDPAMIIYTTGSTGYPKPAMLPNAGIICQNMCMSKGFEINDKDRMLVNLPPSHVGCQTEQLMTTIFAGGISVILHAFKAEKTLQAIEKYRVTAFGQIPSLFVMEWRLKRKNGAFKDYKEYDLSSLRFALYGGQAVSKRFLEKMSEMAPQIGTGLGLTEMCGFVSYTPLGKDVTPDDILASLGHDFPITPLSIREPIKPDGTAGDEKPDGEIGEVCYSGPQVFLGYYDNEEATRKTIAKGPNGERICYTGDLGYKDEKGLHLVGRGKFVIKPKGYQVYPPEIEEFIQQLPEVSLAAVIGVKHEVYSEGVVAFVEPAPGKKITVQKLKEHCKKLAAYKRPSLFIIVDEIPLNRVDKTDYQELKKMVKPIIEKERAEGRWDAER
ncbi:MAG: class I adenylate-forming enzyme family protein [Promethearchaeota archaeon]